MRLGTDIQSLFGVKKESQLSRLRNKESRSGSYDFLQDASEVKIISNYFYGKSREQRWLKRNYGKEIAGSLTYARSIDDCIEEYSGDLDLIVDTRLDVLNNVDNEVVDTLYMSDQRKSYEWMKLWVYPVSNWNDVARYVGSLNE